MEPLFEGHFRGKKMCTLNEGFTSMKDNTENLRLQESFFFHLESEFAGLTVSWTKVFQSSGSVSEGLVPKLQEHSFFFAVGAKSYSAVFFCFVFFFKRRCPIGKVSLY